MSIILGVDEVGRGPLAGPLVVGAVVLKTPIEGLKDSKQLSKKRREQLVVEIKSSGAAIGLGWVPAAEINDIGLSQALKKATQLAVEQIEVSYNEIIIDGTVNFLADTAKGQYVTTIKKADQLIASVSAASIVAKVARDEYMCALQDDKYGFAQHVGYGTKKHLAAIAKYGSCSEHRTCYAPFNSTVVKNTTASKTTKSIGDRAEDQVANYLVCHEHSIVDRNWKTKICEIDIVSQKDNKLFFTEVKYRHNNSRGGGIAAITNEKLQRMKLAARVYLQVNDLQDIDCCLCAASVSGASYEIDDFFELL